VTAVRKGHATGAPGGSRCRAAMSARLKAADRLASVALVPPAVAAVAGLVVL